MTRRIAWCLTALVAVAFSGCADPVQQQLQGRWFGENVENVEAEHLASVTGWVKGTSFEFSGDEVTVAIPGELPRSGPYTVLRAERSRLTLQFQRSDGALDVAQFSVEDEHSMRWHLSGGRAILLRRTN